MSNEQCMICLDTIYQYKWDYKAKCSNNCEHVMCIHCIKYMYSNKQDTSFPSNYRWGLLFRCSLDCLIRTAIKNLDSYQSDTEKDFIKKQQNLLESIYATNALNNFLYDDVINIINEYIL